MRARWFIAAAVAATGAGIGGTSLIGGAAGASAQLSLVAHQTNLEFVTPQGSFVPSPNQGPGPGPGPGPGDRIIIREDLMQGNAVVGFDNIVCTVTFNDNTLCDATFAITNKGDIFVSTLLRGGATGGGQVFDAAIEGGTFAYATSRGDVHLSALPNGDTQVDIHLD
jgi:hypothetical protein